MGEHRKTRTAAPDDRTDTVVALAMLWVIPVFTFVYLLTRI